MTLDELQRRDTRIARLEAIGRGRTRDEDHELAGLINARDLFWRRLPDALARARRRLHALEAHAAQHRLPLCQE